MVLSWKCKESKWNRVRFISIAESCPGGKLLKKSQNLTCSWTECFLFILFCRSSARHSGFMFGSLTFQLHPQISVHLRFRIRFSGQWLLLRFLCHIFSLWLRESYLVFFPLSSSWFHLTTRLPSPVAHSSPVSDILSFGGEYGISLTFVDRLKCSDELSTSLIRRPRVKKALQL